MRWLQSLRARWGHFRTDKDLEDELLSHVAMEAAERRAGGLSDEEARRMLGWGLLGGLLFFLVTTRLVTAMLYGISSFDPVMIVAVATVLTAITLVAALLPAWRAARTDPMTALRAD